MKLYQDSGEIFIPDGQPVEIALARTTHMGIGAHQQISPMARGTVTKNKRERLQRRDRWDRKGKHQPRDW